MKKLINNPENVVTTGDMKKLINDPRAVVRDVLEGAVELAPGQALLDSETVVVQHPLPAPAQRPVAVLSGGGSGHEPAHAGYVGARMLTAAVARDVFTSPSSDAVLAGLRAVAGPAGAVLIVKNYTGDRLNFGLAAEMARGRRGRGGGGGDELIGWDTDQQQPLW